MNPVTLEVVRNALYAIAEEMSVVLMRSARSPLLKEAGDLSSALTDAEGRLIAQGRDIPIHMGVMAFTVKEFLRSVPADRLRAGDVWFLNLPEVGGNHLPDVKAIRPVFAGGRLSFATTEEAKALADSVWATLDKVRGRVADLVLVHGGDGKGVDRIAAAWAERRKVPQVAFGLDRRLGARAGFRRNEQMLSLGPRYLVAFAGNGVLERLVIQAKEKGVAVVDRRGPLGTHPKRAARMAAAA